MIIFIDHHWQKRSISPIIIVNLNWSAVGVEEGGVQWFPLWRAAARARVVKTPENWIGDVKTPSNQHWKTWRKGLWDPASKDTWKNYRAFQVEKHYCLFKEVSFCRLFKDFGSSLMTWWLGCSSSHGPQTAPTKYESVWDVYSEDFRSETLMMKVILMDVDLEVCNRLCELEMKWHFHSMNVVGDKYRVTDT